MSDAAGGRASRPEEGRPPDPTAREPGGGGPDPIDALSRSLVQAGGGSVRAVLLYGSHLLEGARPDRHSAVDFVVVVDDYRPFYEALARAGELPRPPWLMSVLAHVLPPNVIAFAPGDGRTHGIAKSLVVRADHFAHALGSDPKDHFLLGRMIQKVGVRWTRDAEADAWVRGQLQRAYDGVLEWMAPYLEGTFEADSLGRRVLEVCYQGELRPEARDRSAQIFEAQADHFERVFAPVLEEAAERGALERVDGSYRLARPATPAARRKWRGHFRRSKVRATARWLKHTVTFANWLPYVVRKVERHTGREIHLTLLERKLPLIFLWPRAIKILVTRPSRRDS